ncbi:MAG TPA: DUF4396 domain-containing protein [Verrucomicrobiae bacterium]|jgi:hypothetical protein|nr:DUF4396 domain-containing protein [Verrucomicrobiae bacterium]
MITPIPSWLHLLAILVLTVWALCGVIILADNLSGHRQHMAIMNIVWPVTALWAGPVALWLYFKQGRRMTHHAMHAARQQEKHPGAPKRPFPLTVAIGTTHCGAGCTLGDLISEMVMYFAPVTILNQRIFGTWAVDFAAAFILGIVFQYFSIVPMKHLPPGKGLAAALKADALSLAAWQIGMYLWMALVIFLWFGEISKTNPVFWFMMQIAMVCGFLTSYPANWWLLKRGIKERM